jgi:hypothetical protein
MARDGRVNDIDADIEILNAIGRRHDEVSEGLMRTGAPQRTLRGWMSGRRDLPDDAAGEACLMAMALDLALFTPSASGRTPMDRFLATAMATSANDGQALEALGGARWRLVRIAGREGDDEVMVTDLVNGERLRIIDDRLSDAAVGAAACLRLCPLTSGRQVVISPLFALSEATLAQAMGFVRPGKGLGNGYRCAAVLYRECARKGFSLMPEIVPDVNILDVIKDFRDSLSEVERLAFRWLIEAGSESEASLIGDIRRAASPENIIDACGCFGRRGPDELGLQPAFEALARIQIETIVARAGAGVGRADGVLDSVRAAIAGRVAAGRMNAGAGELFERLTGWRSSTGTGAAGEAAPADSSDLARVLNLIQALRAKTVERGCSEAEAMAAAAKVAELLRRHDLTLDEISIRKSDCEGLKVDTGRKRRASIDNCIPTIAAFCDCRVWGEGAEEGALRYVYFGLKADVQAARLLHEMVEAAFDSETAAFRSGAIYLAMTGGQRRTATTSFQFGMASGIISKLDALRQGRDAAKGRGFDLVAVKRAVVDEELEQLGLAFKSRARRARRFVHPDSYQAGRAAGALFEPQPVLDMP